MRVHCIVSGAVVAVGFALVAGCAALPPEQGEAKQQKVYRTGSNLPQRDRSTGEVVVVDPSAISDQLRRTGGAPQGRGN